MSRRFETGSRVVIVGSGVFGLTAAIELRNRGFFVQVVQCEQEKGVVASTGISKIVEDEYGRNQQLYMRMMKRAYAGWKVWNKEFGQTIFHNDGVTVFADLDQPGIVSSHYKQVQQKMFRFKKGKSPCLDLCLHSPVWNPESKKDGYFNPAGGWVEGSQLIRMLSIKAKLLGIEFVKDGFASFVYGDAQVDAEDNGTNSCQGRITGIRTSKGKTLMADTVVMAVGAWSSIVLPFLKPMMQARAHSVMHFKLHPRMESLFKAPAFHPWFDLQSNFFGTPYNPSEGVLKIAPQALGCPAHTLGQVELDAIQQKVEEKELQALQKYFESSFRLHPGLDSASAFTHVGTQIWACNITFDGDFLIDHDPARPGLVLASGANGHGFKFAPILGPLIADVVEQKYNPFASRFRWRTKPNPHDSKDLLSNI